MTEDMSPRENFMFEIWKRTQNLRYEGDLRVTRLKDEKFMWECCKHFWYPILQPLADMAGFHE